MDHIFFHLFPTSVGTVQSVPSANAYLLFASAGADQGESNDAEDNVAKVDVCIFILSVEVETIFLDFLVAHPGFFQT